MVRLRLQYKTILTLFTFLNNFLNKSFIAMDLNQNQPSPPTQIERSFLNNC
ncbi:hypothetical protein PLAN_70583 [Planktothrix rubescens CCAP 1459/22]|uniref:Uncharacterized protein n=1 Tax=Planktothrix rubescens CCAP 1459/22 TaxID=329571 RepID=A0A6J7ZUC9_PLARU|nr:hypothetical protein PLAN_70583 [Planktothrix rubescens NIVA-CYA 18]CAD0226638.1 hypothetical protein PL10110_270007 [Planktothrix agardhii]